MAMGEALAMACWLGVSPIRFPSSLANESTRAVQYNSHGWMDGSMDATEASDSLSWLNQTKQNKKMKSLSLSPRCSCPDHAELLQGTLHLSTHLYILRYDSSAWLNICAQAELCRSHLGSSSPSLPTFASGSEAVMPCLNPFHL